MSKLQSGPHEPQIAPLVRTTMRAIPPPRRTGKTVSPRVTHTAEADASRGRLTAAACRICFIVADLQLGRTGEPSPADPAIT